MKLEELLSPVKPLQVAGSTDIEVADIAIDSRQVKPGTLFVAVPGTQVDGHAFIGKAVEQGAIAVVCQTMPAERPEGVTFVQMADTESAVGPLAHHFFGDPTEKLDLIGVTGTNGKTTIATLLYRMFRQFGYKCGLCSTVCNYIDGVAVPTDHTTPDPITLNRLLGRMADEGCRYAFMEVSSHSVAQHRIGGLKFKGGIFTNLTRDHLDYHKTVEAYRDAKKAFFDGLPADAFVVTNADDKNGLFMTQNTRAQVKTYSLRAMADFRARILEEGFEGMTLDISGHEVFVQFIGRFNVSNLLAVYGAAVCLGKRPEDVLVVLSTLTPVNGRFETIRSREGVTAIVDYAHTPDALDNVLSTINEILKKPGQCITVCGAGGNRDKGKRPLMAQSAVRASDRVIITSDNPRFEEPQDIINDMLAGITTAEDKRKVISIVDRREAIRTACMMAQPGDVILIAGKGHEDYQDVKGVKHHFDDHEVVRETFGIE
ncbi:MAG: UDP-N-acetylmuramoyl-L-alanyl-D-glutamate--2,6-diaminopimelate ligase [Bacteroidaceae bacterium]|nr:UDP-N-acetylmuramoyl-L-alanyl-D-glutamate--2,6-diaminopimelate ligase [Bacteroidaceae bacterium]MBR1800534.1 UDP-N-acetylmuramoyl-L-alanyl-D-glutamate--2,6-diaminopimelate ligase [Bacteroidaceae bacterium]